MSRSAALALAVILVLLSWPGRTTDRALWTWERESYALVEDPQAAGEAIDFLRGRKVTMLYLYADAYQGRNLLVEHPEAYQALIARLHARGIRTYALLGSAYLHTEAYVLPEQRPKALAMLRRVLDFNAAAPPRARFDGVNLDIEPHILDAWDTRRDELLVDFLDMGRALMAEKRRSGQTLAVGPAMAFWLDGIVLPWRGTTKPVSEHAQTVYDYVAVMDYRDHAEGRDGMIRHVDKEMAYAKAHGKRVVVGVEVSTAELQKVSFDHLAEQDLERELGKVEAVYGDNPAFAGFAIHHYRSYRGWLDRQRAP